MRTHQLFWLGFIGFIAFMIWLLSPILLPFVLGMAIAYILDPVVKWCDRRGIKRGLGTSIVILLFFASIITALIILVPLIEKQIVGLISNLPQMTSGLRSKLDALMVRLQVQAGVPFNQVENLQEAAQGQAAKALGWAASVAGGLLKGSLAIINLLSLMFITPVVAFYLLRDWDRLIFRMNSWLPRDHAATIRAQAREIDRTLSGFARGQALMALILAIYYAAGLSIAGLQFGLVVGLMTGTLTVFPFVGTLTGATVTLVLAAIQFHQFSDLLPLIGIFIVGQILEGYILQPWLVGDRVGLHPVWMIFALLAGGALFGVLGILIAVPVTAAIGVLARFGLGRYLTSSLYDPTVAATAALEQPLTEERGV